MTVLLHLLGAAALLLWGLRMVRTGLNRALGARLRHWLAIGTRNHVNAFSTGLIVTCVLQSSTATALMTASFAARNMMAPAMALAVMLGADLGTSLVAQALAVNVGWLSPLLVFVGVVVFMSRDTSRSHSIGRALLGLGLMLLALDLLSDAAVPMHQSEAASALLLALADAPLLAIAISAGLTVLCSSSLAVVLLISTLASHGNLAPETIVALILGANLGSSVLPIIATSTLGNEARWAPVGNLIMRSTGVMLALPATGEIGQFVSTSLSSDLASLALDFHVIFNLVLVVVFLPFVGPLTRLLQHLFPPRRADSKTGPRYLDKSCLDTPAMALSCAARETMRMGDHIETMLKTCREALVSDNQKLCVEIAKTDDEVDGLLDEIKLYLSKLGNNGELDEHDLRGSMEVVSYAINLEHAGDIIDRNLRELVEKKIEGQLSFSNEGMEEIDSFFSRSLENLRLAQSVFLSRNAKLARDLMVMKDDVRDIERQSAEAHLERLRKRLPETIQTSRLHLDILRDLKRINAHITSVAYPILEELGALKKSRLKNIDIK